MTTSTVRQTIRWTLEEEGFLVDSAADGAQALERTIRGRPGLIVLDIRLPLVDGITLADELRATLAEPPPFVLITGGDRPTVNARLVGAYAYLSKPFELDDLVATVRRGLRSSPC